MAVWELRLLWGVLHPPRPQLQEGLPPYVIIRKYETVAKVPRARGIGMLRHKIYVDLNEFFVDFYGA